MSSVHPFNGVCNTPSVDLTTIAAGKSESGVEQGGHVSAAILLQSGQHMAHIFFRHLNHQFAPSL
jgi:hypothetical protein